MGYSLVNKYNANKQIGKHITYVEKKSHTQIIDINNILNKNKFPKLQK